MVKSHNKLSPKDQEKIGKKHLDYIYWITDTRDRLQFIEPQFEYM